MFSQQELQRYSRQTRLPEFAYQGQVALKGASVLVIGAGGLGCPAIQYLVGAGVGKLGVIDGDKVTWSNLHRQILYSESDLGEYKAMVVAQKLSQHNSDIEIIPITTFLNNDNALEVIADYDVIIDGTDNFASRYRINDACVILEKPLVYGALSKFHGQVAVFNYHGSGTYRCIFPTPPNPEDAPNCDEIGVLGPIPGIIGTYQALEAIKIIAGVGEVLANKMLLIETLTHLHTAVSFAPIESNLDITILQDDYEELCGACRTGEVAFNELDAATVSLEEIKAFKVIDLRTEESFSQRNIGGQNVLFSDLKKEINNLEITAPYLIVCEYGNTSKKALEMLLQLGFSNVKHLKGGLSSLFDSNFSL